MRQRIFTHFLTLVVLLTIANVGWSQTCTPSAPQVFSNNTPVAIPTGPAVVTSTINVAGAPTYLYDLNITTAILHTSNADLDITITSPSGTVVTLTTDNGGTFDNVFNGTVWDDQANPAGQVPYANNPGLVTDRTYANLVTATPLVPEEPLGAFIGENPNGTWTITISDDLAANGGTLNSWSLAIQGLANIPTTLLTVASNNTPVAIPSGPAVVTSTINVAGAPTQLLKVTLRTFITHTFSGDLDITITSPAGTVVTLTTDNGGGFNDVFNGTIWDDDANPLGQVPYTSNNGMATDNVYADLVVAPTLTPEEALAAFIGENPNGTWTLTISDDAGGDAGNLSSWALNLRTSSCPPAFVTCNENFDGVTDPALPAGWSAITQIDCANSNPWATSTTSSVSAPNSAFVNDPNCISDEYLLTPSFQVTSAAATVSFQNNFNLEDGFDGMVLEISLNGGPFTDIITAGGSFVTGGYTDVISVNFGSPIAGRSAWSGNSGGFITTTVNLPAAANGQVAQLRFRRATDSSVSGVGVFIDDITYTNTNCVCVITCPANITVSNDPNQCGAVVNYPAPTTNGICGTVTASPASGSFFPRGTTTVTVTSTGGASCTFTITVNDVQPPTITCPANIVTGNTTGQCGAIVNYPAPTASDNCPGVTVVSVPASGSLFPVGTTTVTSTATDGSGNTATCSFTVTVNDTENPGFGSLSPLPERLYYKFDGAGTTIPNLASAPPPGTATATIVGSLSQGSTGKCGGALIGVGAPTPGTHVNTGWAPNLSTPWTISLWLGPNQIDANPSYLFGSLGAGSFRAFYGGAALPNNMLIRGGSGDILISGVNPAATFLTIVYNGTNTVVYKNGGSPQTYNVTFSNSGPGPFLVGGYDNAGFTFNGRIDEFGMYSRALSAGEVATLFATCPSTGSSCPANITVSNTPGQCSAVVTYTAPVGTDNCPGVTTTQIAGLASGATYPVGVTTNTFRATDAAGNTALCTFTVTVNDTQAPTITCPSNITATTPIGSCVAVVNYTVTATDNCPGVTTALQSGLASGSSFPLGVSTVTWRATDASGNTSNCTFTVTVLDGQLPVISQQPANTTSCVGSNVTFSVVSSNVLTYQWQTFSGGTWNNIPGATSSTYTVNNVQTSMNTNTFRVILNGLCTTVTSGTATLFVNTLPIITLSSSRPPFLLPGQFLDITATGIPPGGSFVWLKNGVVIAGATGNTISNLGVDDQGSYTVRYTDPNGCISTSAALVISGMFSDNMWVYPNPNFGQFQVRFFNQNPENATVNVYNSAGAKVYQKSLVTNLPYTMIDINLGPTAADGVYFVELVNQAGKRVGAKQVVVRKR